MLLLSSTDFFQILLKQILSGSLTISVANNLDTDLGPNYSLWNINEYCLQRLL